MKINFIKNHPLFVRISLHVLFWIVYFIINTLLYVVPTENSFMELLPQLLMFLPVDMSATYFTLYFLMTKFLFKKRYVSFSALFIISVVFFITIAQVIRYYIYVPHYHPEYVGKWKFYQFDYFYILVATYAVVIFAAAIKLTKYWIKYQQEQADLKSQNIQSELALLKSQINPHFLFNTLNNIDSMILSDRDKASDSIIKLSEIMRYMLYEANAEKVPLEKEIEYIRNFINLQLLRVSDQNFIKLTVNGNTENKFITPMLFIPFVENAFKHGNKNVRMPAVSVNVDISDEILIFEVVNYINKDAVSKDKTGGIGLYNVRKRLDYIYREKYELYIKDTDNIFKVKLILKEL